jgi:tetratricopeptide (TPR) repeat protein
MLSMLLFASVALLAQEKPAPVPAAANDVVGRIAGTRLFARLDVPGFTRDDRTAKLLQQALGARGIIVGAITGELTMVEVVADKEGDKHFTDVEWRENNLYGSGSDWKHFDSSGIPCAELSVLVEGSGTHDFYAFTVRAGYRFVVHLSEGLNDTHKQHLQREQFDRLVASFHLAVVRLGTWQQLPAAAIELMDGAIKKGADWTAWIDEQAQARPTDPCVPFAKAELLRHLATRPDEQAAAYARAIELLSAKKEPAAPEVLAHAACEDGLALALLDAGDPVKAIPHLEAALKIAHDVTAPVRAGIGYDLARVYARLGRDELAIARLKEAESEEPGALERSVTEKDFDALRKTKAYLDLRHGDR